MRRNPGFKGDYINCKHISLTIRPCIHKNSQFTGSGIFKDEFKYETRRKVIYERLNIFCNYPKFSKVAFKLKKRYVRFALPLCTSTYELVEYQRLCDYFARW